MSDKIAKKKAELELLEAEAEFRAKKADGSLTIEDRHALRELRQSFRENVRQPVKDGAAVETINSKAKAHK